MLADLSEMELDILTATNTQMNRRTLFSGNMRSSWGNTTSEMLPQYLPRRRSDIKNELNITRESSYSDSEFYSSEEYSGREDSKTDSESYDLSRDHDGKYQLLIASFCACVCLYALLRVDSSCATLICLMPHFLATLCASGSLAVLLCTLFLHTYPSIAAISGY